MNKYQEALDKIAKHTNNPRSMYFNLGANEPKKYLDLLQELVDKATPKKPIIQCLPMTIHTYTHTCPVCGKELIVTNNEIVVYKTKTNYCDECGQRLDWSEENE